MISKYTETSKDERKVFDSKILFGFAARMSGKNLGWDGSHLHRAVSSS